jgi:hypothetical protein
LGDGTKILLFSHCGGGGAQWSAFIKMAKQLTQFFYVNIFYFTFLFDIRYIGEYNHQKSAHNYFPFHS